MSWYQWLVRILELATDTIESDQALLIFKYVGTIFAAAYGIYATLTDFKEEKDGRKVLSTKGKIGLALLALSSLLSISSDGFRDFRDLKQKTVKDRLEEQNRKQLSKQLTQQLNETDEIAGTLTEQQKKVTAALRELEGNTRTSRTILQETGRVLQPIKSLDFDFKVEIPSDTPEISNYITRLDREFGERIIEERPKRKESDLSELHVKISEGKGTSEGPGNPGYTKITKILIDAGSPLLPDRSQEPLLFSLTQYLEMTISFYRQPVLLDRRGSFQKSDLDIRIKTQFEGQPITHSLEYDFERRLTCPPFWSNHKLALGAWF